MSYTGLGQSAPAIAPSATTATAASSDVATSPVDLLAKHRGFVAVPTMDLRDYVQAQVVTMGIGFIVGVTVGAAIGNIVKGKAAITANTSRRVTRNAADKLIRRADGSYHYRGFIIRNIAHRHGVLRAYWTVTPQKAGMLYTQFDTRKEAVAYLDEFLATRAVSQNARREEPKQEPIRCSYCSVVLRGDRRKWAERGYAKFCAKCEKLHIDDKKRY